MSLWKRLSGGKSAPSGIDRLYEAAVKEARTPAWYAEGGVPDTIDGRFDMLAAVLALILLRLEVEGKATRQPTVLLTERFIQDMDGSLRQIGIGDLLVGKHVGRMMGALGGRLGAYRDAATEEVLIEAVRRNLFRGAPPSDPALLFVTRRLMAFRKRLEAETVERLLGGELPKQ